MHYSLCHSCTVGVVNGDMSHLEGQEPTELERFMERTGPLAMESQHDHGNYWLCDACGIDQLGEMTVMESVG